jgi:hypothetical protein
MRAGLARVAFDPDWRVFMRSVRPTLGVRILEGRNGPYSMNRRFSGIHLRP